jgi:hypothetical protein
VIVWSIGFQKISFGKNRKRESKDKYYQADLYYLLLWNMLNWLPYHALKVSIMQYQANPSTDFFKLLMWPYLGSYIHSISVDFVATNLRLKHCSCLPCLRCFWLSLRSSIPLWVACSIVFSVFCSSLPSLGRFLYCVLRDHCVCFLTDSWRLVLPWLCSLVEVFDLC